MEGRNASDDLQKARYIAHVLGITERRVNQLTTDGVFNPVQGDSCNLYDVPTTVQSYITYVRKAAEENEILKLQKEKLQADVVIKQSRASMAELELDVYQGRLHRAEDVEAVLVDLAAQMRSRLLALPSVLASDLADAETKSEAAEILRSGICDVLTELTNYRYDPTKFVAKRAEAKRADVDDDE